VSLEPVSLESWVVHLWRKLYPSRVSGYTQTKVGIVRCALSFRPVYRSSSVSSQHIGNTVVATVLNTARYTYTGVAIWCCCTSTVCSQRVSPLGLVVMFGAAVDHKGITGTEQ